MANLTSVEQMVLKALQRLSATSETRMRTAEEVEQKCNSPKGQVNTALLSLANKGFVKRKVREKSAGYYLAKQA